MSMSRMLDAFSIAKVEYIKQCSFSMTYLLDDVRTFPNHCDDGAGSKIVAQTREKGTVGQIVVMSLR
jgi:hypothetical protein